MNKYSNEFKEEAVKRVLSGVPVSQVAREIGVNVSSLYTWKARYLKHPEQPFVGSGKLRDEDAELRKQRIPTGSPVSQILAYHASEDMFYEINAYAESIGGMFTLYVDDMTISSKTSIEPTRIVSAVGKILYDFGHRLSKNKTKYYSKDDFILVTGVVISPNHQLLVPNRLGYKIIRELEHINSTKSSYEDLACLNGLLQAARAIQLNYRNRDSLFEIA